MRKESYFFKKLIFVAVMGTLSFVVSSCSAAASGMVNKNDATSVFEIISSDVSSGVHFLESSGEDNSVVFFEPCIKSVDYTVSDFPPFSGEPYTIVNGNVPLFDITELTTVSYEYYSQLDQLGRCGLVCASIGKDLMPTDERGPIGQVKPSGWHTVKYDIVDENYLYNRCHLIGFQLTGENANERNLITGTRYLNVQGMLPFENMVADYVKETGNHVLYKVVPIYEGDNLVASGVLMQAKSVEDDGDGIEFCVFCYNNQPGIEIDYATGESWLMETVTTEPVAESVAGGFIISSE